MRSRLAAEFVGSAMLLIVIVGSGVMGERLAQGNAAVALLANSVATGCGLFALIVALAPYSRSEFNPLVTLALRGKDRWTAASSVVLAQIAGAIVGVALAHIMFELPLFTLSGKARDGFGQLSGEAIATFGLMFTILSTRSKGPVVVAAAVGCYITAAYWFTSSTSFANPAVTIARSLTPTFAGVAPHNVVPFIIAQVLGASLAYGLFRAMAPVDEPPVSNIR